MIKKFKPHLVALGCWMAGMTGYWLSTSGFEILGGVIALIAVLVFPYALYLGYQQIRDQHGEH